jgi:hypothetical protein
LVRKGWKFVDCCCCGIGISKDNILLVRGGGGRRRKNIFVFNKKGKVIRSVF